MTTVWIYVDTSKEVGDVIAFDYLKPRPAIVCDLVCFI
jgi:hypothetical protein